MSDNTIDRNAAILQRLFFGRGNPVKHKLKCKGPNISTELPLTKTGVIQESPTIKKPHFRVGLESTLKDPKENPAPSNLQSITVTSVAMQGKLFADVDAGLDALPDVFFDSLGVINDEIEAASGGSGQISLAELLSSTQKPDERTTAKPKAKDSGQITARDLKQLGLDVDRLKDMGLTLEELNRRGLKLSDIQQILGT